MNVNIFFGFLLAFCAIYFGAPDIRDNFELYLRSDAFILVFVGTIASTLIGVSFKEFGKIAKCFKMLVFGSKKQLSTENAIKTMIKVAETAQTASKQNLLSSVEGQDMFLDRALEMVGSGLDKEFINQTLETDIFELSKRHNKMINIVRTMGSYAPMFGMAGTVIGVV
ncbi:hypothetical protein DID76_04010, partial [Candidatus Marinamargulisbacteria bacterium SCGC AG-414-C22]